MILPFAGGLTTTANGTLLFSLLAATIYALMLGNDPSWRRTIAKTLAVGLLVILAIIQDGPWLLVIALGLSALGDAFLAHDGERPFIGGLASFLAAHLGYIALFLTFVPRIMPEITPIISYGMALVVIAVAITFSVRLLPNVEKAMQVPVMAYIQVIVTMSLTALFMQSWSVVFGTIIFMASDMALATGRFLLADGDSRQKPLGLFVWVTYYAAQFIICLSVLLSL